MTKTPRMTIRELQRLGRQIFSESASRELQNTIHLDVDLIILEVLLSPNMGSCGEIAPSKDISWLYARLDEPVSDKQLQSAKSLFLRRSRGEPFAYLISRKEFFGRNFLVSKNVLIPRPETELLVERALENIDCILEKRHCLVLELGVGSGCVIISILLELMSRRGLSVGELCNSNAYSFVGVDVSQKAIDVARQNASMFKVDKFVEFKLGSCFEPIESLSARFSSILVVSNPPYIALDEQLPLSVGGFEPEVALRAGKEGLDIIAEIIGGLRSFSLKEKTVLLMEMGYSQRSQVEGILVEKGFDDFDFLKDLAGLERMLELRFN